MNIQFYTSNFPVTGYSRGTFNMLHSQKWVFVPNSFCELVTNNDYRIEELDIDQSYKAFILENEFGFLTSDHIPLRQTSLEYHQNSIIEILVLDLSEKFLLNPALIRQLSDELNIKAIQLIYDLEPGAADDLMEFFTALLTSRLEYFEIRIDCHQYSENIGQIIEQLKEFPMLKVILENASNTVVEYAKTNWSALRLEILGFPYLESFREPSTFAADQKLFIESQKQHTYFNRKLYIGKKGEIKNTEVCTKEFGSIADAKNIEALKSIIASAEFQQYWHVAKESCDVCKDCEFRHMCVDNRKPHQRKDGSWYHKEACDYNPYICKWKGEEGYRTLEDSGVISNQEGYQIDHEEIKKVNQEIWGD